ncbi:TonB-dependent receptor [Ottowia testudinis]|uniref:TonB-dependent receptor n=1 Tax=Ottowia testudinis TaxID=2816950 RepID=A0A975CF15_9BURK|nr:TonB-dependent receptor [Ottowia testudinis]
MTDLHLSVNEFGNARTHLDLGRMVSDSLGVRINAAVEHQDSHINKVSGPRQFLSGAMVWKPTSDTTVDLDVEYEKRSRRFQPGLALTTSGELPPMPDSKTFLGQDWAQFETEATTVEARLEHRLNPDWKVSLQANHFDMTRKNDWFGFGDIDGTTGDVATVMFWGSDDKYKSSSARLMAQGTLDTGSVKHRLAFGYDWAYSYFDWSKAVWNGDIGDTNLFNPVPLPPPAAGNSGGMSETVRSGVFIQDVLALGEKWDLHLGGRHATLDQQTDGYKKSTFTPSAALVFKPLANLSAYVSYVEGLEQGGMAPTGTTNANQVMGPLVSKQWETGLKGEVGLLNWEASLFQLSKAAEYTSATNTYVQSGDQQHQGVELSLSGKVSREVTLYGGLMWLDAKLKETGDAATNGKRPPGVAEQRAVLTAEYAPAALSGWTFMANWTHTGKRAVNSTNTAFAPAYDLFGVGLRHQRKVAGHDTTFRLSVDNLFGKRYWANVADDFLIAGAPRTVWASMSVKF